MVSICWGIHKLKICIGEGVPRQWKGGERGGYNLQKKREGQVGNIKD